MGIFSRKKKVVVSSVTYNLAGDEKDRVQFLPTTVLTKIISNNTLDVADAIRNSLLNGPGIRLRSFARWSRRTGYDRLIGLQTANVVAPSNINVAVLEAQIPHDPDQTVSIASSEIGIADYGYWVDQWMAENHPDQIDAEYEADFDEASNVITLTFPDATVYSFEPVGFNIKSHYLYANYLLTKVKQVAEPVMDAPIVVDSFSDFPPTPGWDVEDTKNTTGTENLVETETTVLTYSDGRPSQTSTQTRPSTADYSDFEITYSDYVYLGSTEGAAVDSLDSYLKLQRNVTGHKIVNQSQTYSFNEPIEGGVTRTTTVTLVTQFLQNAYSYQTGTQQVIDKEWSPRKTFIYRQNSGNATLDSMFGVIEGSATFFPFIPIRQGERMLDEDYFPEIYEANQKAYKKAFGPNASYKELIDKLHENKDIKDVDHAFITFGVAANTLEKASRKYIYLFMQYLLQQGHEGDEYDTWQYAWDQADAQMKAWAEWREAQNNPASPLFGTTEPTKVQYPASVQKQFLLSSEELNFNMGITWDKLVETVQGGLGKTGAKVGDVWFRNSYYKALQEILYSGGKLTLDDMRAGHVELVWQDTLYTHRIMTITNMAHHNLVYQGKGVGTALVDAISDPEVSGFIFPLHEKIFNEMSLATATQMSQANAYLVMNCYEVVKQKWYQTGLFKVILVIVIIVITVLTGGAGGASAGLLGTAASVGAALGFYGTVAVIVGTVANAVAAMLLTQIIMAGSTALFGEKVGAIVGAIASVIAVSVGSSYMSGQGFAAGFSNLSSVENLTKLTVAAGNGLAEYIGAETADIANETAQLVEQYTKDSAAVLSAWQENLGTGQVLIDPMQFTDAVKEYAFVPESPTTFLSRTLLTGSDIAGMTNDMISNFAAITLSTSLS